MKTYALKEIFKTLQGEGQHAGRPCILARFAGCNGWSGLESDRERGPFACSRWCDTSFVGTDGTDGGRYYPSLLAARAKELWAGAGGRKFIVLTGGEPMLQVDGLLIDTLHRYEFEVAIETNGTREVPCSADWITVSPKAGSEVVQRTGQELKLVHPQPGAEPERFAGLNFRHFFLQPMDGPDREANTQATVDYCLSHPQWRLGLQAHKFVGLR